MFLQVKLTFDPNISHNRSKYRGALHHPHQAIREFVIAFCAAMGVAYWLRFHGGAWRQMFVPSHLTDQ